MAKLVERIRAGAEKTGAGPILFITLMGVLGLLISVTMIALPIAAIVVGAINLDNCGLQKNIPIYLVVHGVVTLLAAGFSYAGKDDKDKNAGERCNAGVDAEKTEEAKMTDGNEAAKTNELTEDQKQLNEALDKAFMDTYLEDHEKSTPSSAKKVIKVIRCVIGLFTFAWTITGAVWVFGKHKEYKEKGTCESGVYWLAFSIEIIYCMLIGVGLLGACSLCCLKGGAAAAVAETRGAPAGSAGTGKKNETSGAAPENPAAQQGKAQEK